LVQNDFKLSLMAPEDLKEFAGLTTTTVVCRQRVVLAAAGVELIKWSLEGTFGAVTMVLLEAKVEEVDDNGNGVANGDSGAEEKSMMDIMGGAVRLTHRAPSGEVEIEWEGNLANDSIADAVMAVLLTVESSPAAVRQSSKLHNHSHSHGQEKKQEYDAFGDPIVEEAKSNGDAKQGLGERRNPHANVTPEERLSRLFMFLEAQFGEDAISPLAAPRISQITTNGTTGEDDNDDVAREKLAAKEVARLHALGIPVPGLEIRVDKHVAKVWLEDLDVECANKTLGDRVRAVVERGVGTVAPLWG